MKALRLKKDMVAMDWFQIKAGTILPVETWCTLIGRAGTIDPMYGTDKDWWEYVDKTTERENTMELREALIMNLGGPGRIISMSKSTYRESNPKNAAVFNANLIATTPGLVGEFAKIWFGDIDITKDEEGLKKIAESINKDLYVLYEMDGRFEYESAPNISSHVVKITPNGDVTIGNKHAEHFHREDGLIKRK